MAKKRTEIQKADESGLVIPDYIENTDEGTENINAADVVLPRIKISQAMTKEHTEHEVPLGNWTENINAEDYGKEIDFICLFVKKGWMKFKDDDEGSGIEARKFEGDFLPPINPEKITEADKLWNNKTKEPPAATQVYIFLGLINNSEISIISFMSTGIRTAKKFNTMLKKLVKGKKMPAYARHYKLTTVKTSNSKGQIYYTPEVSAGSFLTKEEYSAAKNLFEQFSKKSIQAEVVSKEEEPKEEVPF